MSLTIPMKTIQAAPWHWRPQGESKLTRSSLSAICMKTVWTYRELSVMGSLDSGLDGIVAVQDVWRRWRLRSRKVQSIQARIDWVVRPWSFSRGLGSRRSHHCVFIKNAVQEHVLYCVYTVSWIENEIVNTIYFLRPSVLRSFKKYHPFPSYREKKCAVYLKWRIKTWVFFMHHFKSQCDCTRSADLTISCYGLAGWLVHVRTAQVFDSFIRRMGIQPAKTRYTKSLQTNPVPEVLSNLEIAAASFLS